jgi:hypothetical protein
MQKASEWALARFVGPPPLVMDIEADKFIQLVSTAPYWVPFHNTIQNEKCSLSHLVNVRLNAFIIHIN